MSVLHVSTPEVRFALDAVRRSSLLAGQVQGEVVHASLSKRDRSPVTVADFAVQAVVGGLLAEVFPNDPLVAEEDSTELRIPERQPLLARVAERVGRVLPPAAPQTVCAWIDRGASEPATRFWTLDPIDGTTGFLRGDQYAVALALVIDGQVQVGVLGCPNLSGGFRPETGGPGSLVVAARGQGTWTAPLNRPGDFTRLRVSACADATRARLLRSVEPDHTDVGLIEAFARLLGMRAAPVSMDSQAKYAVLAAGGGELLLRLPSPRSPEYQEKIWDHAAGALVVEEAGGCITDSMGQPLGFARARTLCHNRGVLASNGHLHATALQALTRLRHEAGEAKGGET